MAWLIAVLAWFIPDDEVDCPGCGLDRQWIGSTASDHICAQPES